MTTTTPAAITSRTPHSRRSPLAIALIAGVAASLAWAGAAMGADLPLTDITLYRSGVGSFSHNGTVDGDETVELDFGVERVNDILKSMVLLDFGGGEVSGVVYEPNRSINDRLADFTIDPRQASSMAGLMTVLRGEPIQVEIADGDSIKGTVLGVESRAVTNPGAPDNVSEHWATLLTGSGIRTLRLDSIRSMQILNEDLAEELERGLAAFAEHRSDRRTSVEVGFDGEGERKVSVVYTHSAPVWKVSYRLILPDGTSGEPYLQGWAIVENDTDADWDDVSLSLASGRPVSFQMDLQTPLNTDRPMIPVPVLAGVGPVVYQSTMPGTSLSNAPARGLGQAASKSYELADGARAEESKFRSRTPASGPQGDEYPFMTMQNGLGGGNATAGEAGEQFMYTIDSPVSVDRGESAMLPIMGQEIDGRRLTIFSPSTGVARPMRGVELTNDTGLHLPPGPISVYDADAYAGDAQIRHTSRDQKRLLSYAVDLDVDVTSERDSKYRATKLSIVDGMIVEKYHRTDTETYTITNRDSKRDRTVMIERPQMNGWELDFPKKADEETEHAERYLVDLNPGETDELVVEHSRTDSTRIAFHVFDMDRLINFQTSGVVSDEVVSAIRKAAQMKSEIRRMNAQMTEIDREQNSLTQDQERIRRNMGSVQRGTDLHTRYVRKLSTQEDRMETILTQREDLLTKRDQTQRELDKYLSDLTIG